MLVNSDLDWVVAGCPYIKDGHPAGRALEHRRSFPGGYHVIAPRDVAMFLVRHVHDRWRAARSMKTELPLDALEMAALWNRERLGHNVKDLIHHSDAGSQYTSIRYTQRLIEAGFNASIGSVGDSYVLAESLNGLYKAELVFWEGPWRGADDLELATLGWVDWFNHVRIHCR